MDSYNANYKDIEQFFNNIDGMMYTQKQRKKEGFNMELIQI